MAENSIIATFAILLVSSLLSLEFNYFFIIIIIIIISLIYVNICWIYQ